MSAPRTAAQIEAAVGDAGLLSRGDPVLVMFSGGRDSSCLLDLAVRINGAETVRALHVNYGLRSGAVLDERHCQALCERLGVALSIERPPGPPVGANLQAWAREVRYAAAAALAGVGTSIAAGHTADDQVETILYRLISSPSRRALVGMAPRSGNLIRPLLGLTRAETTGYCAQRGLSYRDDPTNVSAVYVRNRIRHELLPLLRELHPGVGANLLALSAQLRDEQQVLDDVAAHAVAARTAVPLPELRRMPLGLARLAVQRLADALLEVPAAGVGRRVGDIMAMGEDARLDLPGGVRAVTERGCLRFERTPPLRR